MLQKGGASPTGGFRGTRILAWLNRRPIQIIPDSRHCRHYMRSVPADCGAKGSGQSMQKLGFLPEAQNDMVFSIICEELGLFGAFA